MKILLSDNKYSVQTEEKEQKNYWHENRELNEVTDTHKASVTRMKRNKNTI